MNRRKLFKLLLGALLAPPKAEPRPLPKWTRNLPFAEKCRILDCWQSGLSHVVVDPEGRNASIHICRDGSWFTS